MLIISEEQFLKELSEDKSKSIQFSDSLKSNGTIVLENSTYDNFRKPAGVPNIPNEIKPVIASLAATESQDSIQEAFKVSKDTIGNLSNDNHSNELVKERKIAVIEKVKEQTIKKIEQCIEFLEVVKETSNKELLSTAESLSRIHRNINPTSQPTEGTNVQFVFYAPERENSVSSYPIIESS